MKIHHFGIEVSDIDKSLKFYCEKLGFTINVPKTYEKNENVYYAYIQLSEQGSSIELIQLGEKKEYEREGIKKSPALCPHIGLETKNFDQLVEQLKEKKIAIFDGPHVIPHDVKLLTILDPDNYRIDIGQLLK